MRFSFFITMCFLAGCSEQAAISAEQPAVNTQLFDYDLGLLTTYPVLKISCEFDDCGEWGGRREEFFLLKNDKTSFCLDYQKYSVDCDKMIEIFDGSGYVYGFEQVLEKKETFMATESVKKAIRDFATEIMRSKFEADLYFSHAGVFTTISNQDSSLFIRTYSSKAEDFNRLKQRLGL